MSRLCAIAALLALSGCAHTYASSVEKPSRCEAPCDDWSKHTSGLQLSVFLFDVKTNECVCYQPLAPSERATTYFGGRGRETMVRFPAPPAMEPSL